MRVICSKEEADSFICGEYDEEAMKWLIDNVTYFQQRCDLAHVLHCLKGIVAHVFGLHPVGDFGMAVLRNDLKETIGLADDTNQICLSLYITFLRWKVPFELLNQAKKQLNRGR